MTSAGDIVVATALECRPRFLVLDVEDDHIGAALLADLSKESIQRLVHGHTETVLQAVRQTDVDTYRVPREDVAPTTVLEAPP